MKGITHIQPPLNIWCNVPSERRKGMPYSAREAFTSLKQGTFTMWLKMERDCVSIFLSRNLKRSARMERKPPASTT